MDEILGLKKPFPITNPLSPMKKNVDEKVSSAMHAWPRVMIKAPRTVAFL